MNTIWWIGWLFFLAALVAGSFGNKPMFRMCMAIGAACMGIIILVR